MQTKDPIQRFVQRILRKKTLSDIDQISNVWYFDGVASSSSLGNLCKELSKNLEHTKSVSASNDFTVQKCMKAKVMYSMFVLVICKGVTDRCLAVPHEQKNIPHL